MTPSMIVGRQPFIGPLSAFVLTVVLFLVAMMRRDLRLSAQYLIPITGRTVIGVAICLLALVLVWTAARLH
jgi:hypothetical protein